MSYHSISYAVQDGVAWITLQCPLTGNAFSNEVNAELLQALDVAEHAESVRVVVLCGAGRIFSAGGDLRAMEVLLQEGRPEEIGQIVQGVHDVAVAIKRLPKPVIVAAHGAVAGAAFNIALAADFCIATEGTKFVQAFVKIGLIPDGGGLFLLSRAVGMTKAMHWAMTGDAITAEEGKTWGFVYEVCPKDALQVQAEALAKRLAQGPRQAYAHMKRLLWEAQLTEWENYARQELASQVQLCHTTDFAEGVAAFLEKRNPKFL